MRKVIVVDDATTVRKFLREVLEKEGFEVEEAANGLEALEKALVRDFDLFVIDINMPVLDGCSLVQKLRESSEIKQVPILIVTTESGEKDIDTAYERGANFYLVKPVKPKEFLIYVKLLTGVRL
ncbi:MAG: response regulator [Synergistetes bacterium]|nr:response regulator [Synergistota bacterium]MDW8193171.1 response regulator [Synergistota bacterium]